MQLEINIAAKQKLFLLKTVGVENDSRKEFYAEIRKIYIFLPSWLFQGHLEMT